MKGGRVGLERHMNIKLTGLLVDSSCPIFKIIFCILNRASEKESQVGSMVLIVQIIPQEKVEINTL